MKKKGNRFFQELAAAGVISVPCCMVKPPKYICGYIQA